MKTSISLLITVLFSLNLLQAQYVSKVWKGDLGDGRYKNPIINADYSDPDVCLGADGYYMVASSFNCVPGLPVLFSKDLVNWSLVGHALSKQIPEDFYNKVQHGSGVWAPSIRYHNKEYYVYWGNPDFGIFMVKASNPRGPWTEPHLVKAGKGLIDVCPLWDEDGKAYMSFALAGSRAGLKSVLLVAPMSPDGKSLIGEPRIIYDGHESNPTIEGTKFHKHEGKYYIFAPAGGVSTGWQVVLKADHPYGPWQVRTVMHQGNTSINGPHQGAWVRTPQNEDWFIHFQDVGVMGRVIHLNPMQWKNAWPVIGLDKDKDGIGEPVTTYRKPAVAAKVPVCTPVESDEFDKPNLGLQWQWQANPNFKWYYLNPANGGNLRLYSFYTSGAKSLWDAPNLLLQNFPAPEFKATTKIRIEPDKRYKGERGGLVVMGMDYAVLCIENTENTLLLTQNTCNKADNNGTERIVAAVPLTQQDIYLRVEVKEGQYCSFHYSLDGQKFIRIGTEFKAREGKWIGAKIGLFCTRPQESNDGGWLDVSYFRIEP